MYTDKEWVLVILCLLGGFISTQWVASTFVTTPTFMIAGAFLAFLVFSVVAFFKPHLRMFLSVILRFLLIVRRR